MLTYGNESKCNRHNYKHCVQATISVSSKQTCNQKTPIEEGKKYEDNSQSRARLDATLLPSVCGGLQAGLPVTPRGAGGSWQRGDPTAAGLPSALWSPRAPRVLHPALQGCGRWCRVPPRCQSKMWAPPSQGGKSEFCITGLLAEGKGKKSGEKKNKSQPATLNGIFKFSEK